MKHPNPGLCDACGEYVSLLSWERGDECHPRSASKEIRYVHCTCVDVDFGSYDVTMAVEPYGEVASDELQLTRNGGAASIDRCILPEVSLLWTMGIRTIESCCGHGKSEAYIAVAKEFETRMTELGYARSESAPHVFLARGLDLKGGAS